MTFDEFSEGIAALSLLSPAQKKRVIAAGRGVSATERDALFKQVAGVHQTYQEQVRHEEQVMQTGDDILWSVEQRLAGVARSSHASDERGERDAVLGSIDDQLKSA